MHAFCFTGASTSRGKERKDENTSASFFSFIWSKLLVSSVNFTQNTLLMAYCAHKKRAAVEIIVLFMVRKAISIKSKSSP